MRSQRAAFTLIELLVVIAIVAILVGMISHIAGKAIDKANQTKSLNNMRQIAAAFMLYAGDNNGRFPSRPPDGDGSKRWPALIDDYLKDKTVFAAPDDPDNYLKTHSDPISNDQNNTSYIMNSGMDWGRSPADVQQHPVVLANISEPSKTILVGLIYSDTNFFLDVAQNDADLINPNQFGSGNNYVFMDGSARMMTSKEYEDLNEGHAKLWLLDKSLAP